MKENSREEDITKIEGLKYLTLQATIKDKFICAKIPEDYIQALEHILSDYKRALKENEELKSNNEKYIIHLTDEQYKTVIEIAQNDINQKWIQKVKDKIEELKEQYNVRELDFIKTTQDIRKIIIQSLEELIEGKN